MNDEEKSEAKSEEGSYAHHGSQELGPILSVVCFFCVLCECYESCQSYECNCRECLHIGSYPCQDSESDSSYKAWSPTHSSDDDRIECSDLEYPDRPDLEQKSPSSL